MSGNTKASAVASLENIENVGSERASELRDAGFETTGAVASARSDELEAISGIGEVRARAISESAQELLSELNESDDVAPTVTSRVEALKIQAETFDKRLVIKSDGELLYRTPEGLEFNPTMAPEYEAWREYSEMQTSGGEA